MSKQHQAINALEERFKSFIVQEPDLIEFFPDMENSEQYTWVFSYKGLMFHMIYDYQSGDIHTHMRA